jgi:condensin complex subunit 3
MLSENRLPDHLLPLCLDVLREVVNNERDYILIIVEEIQDLLEPLRSSEAMACFISSPAYKGN